MSVKSGGSSQSVTIQNEVLRSYQEVEIANFLYLNNIDYEYELMQASSVDFNWEAMKEEIETHLAPL